MSVRGPLADRRELEEALFLAAGQLTFDYSVQEDSVLYLLGFSDQDILETDCP